jgi:hypothetical protein
MGIAFGVDVGRRPALLKRFVPIGADMPSHYESQLEPSNVIPGKIEPLHREIPGMQQNSVETSTRPQPGVTSPAKIGLKWGGMAYAASWIISFLIVLGVAAKADWFGGPVGIQVLISVVMMGLTVLAGLWAGKGRPAWRNPAKAVVALHVVSVLLLWWATRVSPAENGPAATLPWGRGGVIGLGVVSLAIVAIGVWLGMARDRGANGPDALPQPAGSPGDYSRAAIMGIALGVAAQLALGAAWFQVARAVIPSTNV